jgi:hypothetical protein
MNGKSEARLSPGVLRGALLTIWLGVALLSPVAAQTCLTSDDLDAATRSQLEATARRYFDMASQGDVAGLKQDAIPSVASSFTGIERAVIESRENLVGAQVTVRPPYVLQADGQAPLERAEFLCGVFGARGQTASSAVFVLSNLPPGKYALTVVDAASTKIPYTVSFVLQQLGSDWKLGGFYARPSQVGGHDALWFAERAREFKAKGQTHNAWLYFVQARELAVPVPFMSTMLTDKLYDESQAARPSDLPTAESPVEISAQVKPIGAAPPPPAPGKAVAPAPAGIPKTFRLTSMFPVALGNDLDLVVKYDSPDISNTSTTYAENIAVIHALVAKYPELRDAFAGIVARAVEPSGRDYGTLLAMKDVK